MLTALKSAKKRKQRDGPVTLSIIVEVKEIVTVVGGQIATNVA